MDYVNYILMAAKKALTSTASHAKMKHRSGAFEKESGGAARREDKFIPRETGKEAQMDIAVLSDIHGNHIALERCVEYALGRGIRTFCFLGDYTGELAFPGKVMSCLYELDRKFDCHFIRGNKEDYWLNYRAGGEKGWKDRDSTTGSLLYSYERLTKRDLDFYEGLPVSRTVIFEDLPPLTICHGSPYRANEKLLPGKNRTWEIMDESETAIILCGHTHLQGKIVHNGRMVLNAGAVGVPLQSGGRSQFLILHGDKQAWTEEFVSLDYDVESVIRELYEEKLDEHAPCWCCVTKRLLREGKVAHGSVLNRAMELCRAETGSCVWPDVPERFWQQAVKEMLG